MGYTRRAFWWELVEDTKKLAFSSLILLAEGQSGLQLQVFMICAFAYLLLQASVRPFSEAHVGRIVFASHVSLFLLLLCAFLIAGGRSLPGGLVIGVPMMPLVLAAALGLYIAAVKLAHLYFQRRSDASAR